MSTPRISGAGDPAIAADGMIPLLSAQEIAAIEHECAHLPNRESAAIDALRIVQGQRGWVSDESVRGIARLLGMSTEGVDAIATFYSLIHRRPDPRLMVLGFGLVHGLGLATKLEQLHLRG